jgi:2-oxoglutarate ferredoxin oxidoreductase subunit delta
MGYVKINNERCKGCGYCILACNKGCLAIGEDERNQNGYSFLVFTEGKGCNSCTLCARVCPDAALEVYQGKEQH